MDDFKNHPQTIGEIRADKSEMAKDWTPRDLLISMLRDIDEGKLKPTVLVVAYSYDNEDDSTTTNWRAAAPNSLMTFGTMTRALYRMNRAGEEAD